LPLGACPFGSTILHICGHFYRTAWRTLPEPTSARWSSIQANGRRAASGIIRVGLCIVGPPQRAQDDRSGWEIDSVRALLLVIVHYTDGAMCHFPISTMLAWLLAATFAYASTLPWCTGGGESGAPSCGYSSFEQCRANSRTCFQNPYLDAADKRPATQSRR